MAIDEVLALLVVVILVSLWTYSLGYKDGKREGHLQAAKWRKQVNANG
jgi:hypothetical protein